jgi:hypoxanthine phosphoribosyltransferase
MRTTSMAIGGQGYFDMAFGDSAELIANAERTLKGLKVDFNGMVAIGLSGVLVLPLLARHFDVPFFAVRKEGVECHDGYGAGSYGRGTIGSRWILVDDFVASGRTIETAKRRVKGAIDAQGCSFTAEYAGTYCYEKRYDDPEAGHFVTPDMRKHSVSAIEIDGTEMFVDAVAKNVITERVKRYKRVGMPDPKGEAIKYYREDYVYGTYDGPSLKTLSSIAIYAERMYDLKRAKMAELQNRYSH